MSTTWQRVEQAIAGRGVTLKSEGVGKYRGNSPLRTGSDSNGFTISVDPDGEHGTFFDHAREEDQGSLYDLADRLGVQKGDGRAAIDNTKRAYLSIEDYADAHGIPAAFLESAKWVPVTHKDRPALEFQTATGKRYRFLDDQQPVYISEYGYTACWYGLTRAITIANQQNTDAIVLCNGEISTLAAQYHNVPAFAMTSGEKAISDSLLSELNHEWSGRIIIALDCDDKGRKVAQTIKAQLPNSEIVDLKLSDKGDLADFCKINTHDSLPNLLRLSTTQNPKDDVNPHATNQNRSDMVREQLRLKIMGDAPVKERAFAFPLKTMRKFGGFMRNCVTGKVTLIAGGTGTGKTQLLETFCDQLNVRGVNGLWFGAEWSKEEMEMRRVQRYSKAPHVTYDNIQEHLTYLGYQADGVPDSQNSGTKLTDAQIESYHKASAYLNTWRGTMECFNGHNTLEETFADMTVAVERECRQNRLILFVVFDYVQLLKAKSWDNSVNRYEYAFECVKQFAIDMNLHVFMTTQVNKQASAESKGNKSLNAEAAHYIRGDKANLFLILDRQYTQEHSEEYTETNAFYLVVGKSSLGGRYEGYTESKIRVPLVMHPQHLHFREQDWRTMPQFAHLEGNRQNKALTYESNGHYTDNQKLIDEIPI